MSRAFGILFLTKAPKKGRGGVKPRQMIFSVTQVWERSPGTGPYE